MRNFGTRMESIPIPLGTEHELTRQRLAAGSMIESLRSNLPTGVSLRTDAEMDQTLEAILGDHDPDRDSHIFGYGSLMWNPAMDAATRKHRARSGLAPALLSAFHVRARLPARARRHARAGPGWRMPRPSVPHRSGEGTHGTAAAVAA